MMLSPRQMLAVGLLAIAAGISVYLIGMVVGVWISSSVVTVTGPEQIHAAMRVTESARRVTTIAVCLGGPMALSGIGLSLAGAVRWLLAKPNYKPVNTPADSRPGAPDSN